MATSAAIETAGEWRNAFKEEWLRLAQGKVDAEQIADWAIELYPTHWRRDPAEVAREEWNGSAA